MIDFKQIEAFIWVASPKLKLHGRLVAVSELSVYPIITYPVGSLPYRIVSQLT